MKNTKIIWGFFSAAVLSLIFALNTGANDTKIFEIREKMFIQQCNDIYFNADEYLGRTVKLEGIFGEFPNVIGGEPEQYVYRNAPGCCGYDGMAGFRVLLDDCPAPKQYAWVEATGTVEITSSGTDDEDVVLRLSSLKVTDKRGSEFVTN